MAWSVIQSVSGGPTNAASVASSALAALTNGTKLLAYVGGRMGGGAGVVSVSDGVNSFTKVAEIHLGQGVQNGSLWELDHPNGSGTTITASWTTGSHFGEIIVQEISGLAAAPAADGTAGTSSGTGSGSVGPPTYTSSASNEFLTYMGTDDAGNFTWTIPGGYTADAHNINAATSNLMVAYKNSTNGTETGAYSISGSTNWALIMVAFKLSSVAAVNGTVQPWSTVPVPRRRAARAAWRGSVPFTGFVAVAAPTQQPRLLPRRTTARAVVQFTPVTTTNAAAAAGVAGSVPVQMVQRTEVISRVTGRVVRR